MSKEIIVNEEASAFFLSQSNVLISTKAAIPKKDVATPTSPEVKKTFINSTDKIAKWGDDNLFPQTVYKEARKSTIIPSTLDWKARALYSGGIVAGKVSYKEANGGVTEIFTPEINKEFDEFKKRSALNRYLIEATNDFYWFYNPFPELVLSKDRKKIVAISAQESMHCRWGLQNPKTGLVEQCFINANWDDNEDENSKTTTKVAVIDPYYDPVGSLRERDDAYKYIYPISYPTPGGTYYQLAHWNSIRESGWLEFTSDLVKFKKALVKNNMSIKYQIEIAEWWWEWKYPQWKELDPKKKIEIMTSEVKKINDFLKGAEAAGKSIITVLRFDPHTGEEQKGWTINVIDDKFKDGAYIEDSQEGSSHMLYALGVDGTLIGNAPGKGMGAGSGSDKRVAFDIYISLCKVHQDIILDPLTLIRDYNGWDPDLEFRFRSTLITTLDTGKETTQKPS